MGVESPTHIAYKKIAIDILKEKGFSGVEIHEEYNVEFQYNGRLKYTVDVAGIKDGYKVAIECGGVEHSKILDLRKIFDEVIVIRPETLIDKYEYWRAAFYNQKNEIKALQERNQKLVEHAEWVCNDANKQIEPFQAQIKELEAEIIRLKNEHKKLQKVIATAWEATNQKP